MENKDPYVGLLVITVVDAQELPKMDLTGKADPYVAVRFGESKLRTSTVQNSLNPVWNQQFKVLVKQSERNYNVEFDVWDYDWNTKDDFIGQVWFDIRHLWSTANQESEHTLSIVGPKNESRGTLRVKLMVKEKKQVERDFWISFASYFDADQTNTISLLEMTALFEALQSSATDDEIKSLFDRANKDGDDQITFDEFCNFMSLEGGEKNPILHRILPEHTMDFIWDMSAKLDKKSNIGALLMERDFYGKVKERKQPGEKDKILVHERATGKMLEEKIPEYIKMSLRMMYSTSSGRFAIDGLKLKKLLQHLTEQQAKQYNRPESKKEIAGFISYHNLNVDEIEHPLESFTNFNEFFYRTLKSTARPIADANDPSVAVSAADCRLHVFPALDDATRLWVKGKNFSLTTLLQDAQLAKEYEGGSLVIHRLAPQDYHRFHSPVTGTLLSVTPINGAYYTVNPIAIREQVDVYTENKRVRTVIKTAEFGDVVFIAVGATCVGSIYFTKQPGANLKKGDELGYFAFGGSTTLVLFKKGTIQFDADLLVNSFKPIETLVAMGASIGRSTLYMEL